MIKPYECTQCGSTSFEDISSKRVRCTHCGSLFQLLTRDPSLVIKKGANVTFGKNAQVEIHGDVEIDQGAKVDIQGKVELVRGGKKQVFELILIQNDEQDQE